MEQAKLWWFDNWFHRRARKLQHLQLEEHRQIIAEVKQHKHASLHDQAELVWKLDAVTEQLEQAIRDMEDDQ